MAKMAVELRAVAKALSVCLSDSQSLLYSQLSIGRLCVIR